MMEQLSTVLSPGLAVLERMFGLGEGTRRMLYGKRKPPHKSLLASYANELIEKKRHEEEDFQR